MLCLQGWAATFLADWKVALPAAEEAGRLAVETREPVWAAGSKVVTAMVAVATALQLRFPTTVRPALGVERHPFVLGTEGLTQARPPTRPR